MEKENKYMVLVFYQNSIQGEYSVAGHGLGLKHAIQMMEQLRRDQKEGRVDEDYLIENPEKNGIRIVEYVDFVY